MVILVLQYICVKEADGLRAGNDRKAQRTAIDLADGHAGAQSLDMEPGVVRFGTQSEEFRAGSLEVSEERWRVENARNSGGEMEITGRCATTGFPAVVWCHR